MITTHQNGFCGLTPVRTSRGFITLKSITDESRVLGDDGAYHQVATLCRGRADKLLSFTIYGLPYDILITPDCFVAVGDGTKAAYELRPVDVLSAPIPCPVNTPPVYDDLYDVFIHNLQLLGAFYAVGGYYDSAFMFEKRFLNDALQNEIGRYKDVEDISDEYLRAILINDPKLVRLTQELFGLTGTGPLPDILFELTVRDKFRFISGVLNSIGREQADGRLRVSFSNYDQPLEFLQFLWSANIPASADRVRCSSSLLPAITFKRTPLLNEHLGELAADHSISYSRSHVQCNGSRVLLPILSIQWIDWAGRPVYNLEIQDNVSYAVGMISAASTQGNGELI